MNDAGRQQKQPADPDRRSHVKLSKEIYIELAAFSDSVYDRGRHTFHIDGALGPRMPWMLPDALYVFRVVSFYGSIVSMNLHKYVFFDSFMTSSQYAYQKVL